MIETQSTNIDVSQNSRSITCINKTEKYYAGYLHRLFHVVVESNHVTVIHYEISYQINGTSASKIDPRPAVELGWWIIDDDLSNITVQKYF